ncbi:MAG TPA: LppX_LprAFG lipoprotein [Solirubrobacterales bacterium]|nr:LppX_LprAFG lipoprotein [Solirubrobacterales bacterium]
MKGSAGIDGEATGRRRGRRWVGAGLAVVVIAVIALVVAQGGGSGGGPLNAIAKAAEVTQREPGGRALIRATITVSNTPEGITEDGSLVFDDSGRSRGTLTVQGHSTGKEVKVTTIADGTKTYATSDAFDSIPEGKKWMELDYSSAVSASGSAVPDNVGPEEGLKILERVEGAKEIGKEVIGGVPTTRYRGTLPTAAEVFGVKTHFSALNVDVWIDAQHRVRRMQAVVSGTVGEAEDRTTTEMTIDYVEFGRVSKIEPPPADEVFDATGEIESRVQSAAEGH